MANPYFKFKKFTVYHDQCAMKVGTDGVLLGAWTTAINPKKILDIGTGSGLIALMIAQRFPESNIQAIEIDENAVQQAKSNIETSPYKHIQVFETSLQQFQTEHRFDLIVTNPPFFKVSSLSTDSNRTVARQFKSLSPEDIFAFAAKHLTPTGILALIFPAEVDLGELAVGFQLFPVRKVMVAGQFGSKPKRILWEFGFADLQPVCQELTIELSRGIYTDEFKKLLQDFYLYL